jgi:peptide deformylase
MAKKNTPKFEHAVPVTSGLKNPILRAVSKAVEIPSGEKSHEGLSEELVQLLEIMLDTMVKEEGIGIAAPQVGVNLRVALAVLNPHTRQKKMITMINPEISKKSLRTGEGEEGCLSLRGKWGKVDRALSLTVTYFDEHFQKQVLELEGLNARIIQHEVDHLDGTLFWDRVKEVIADGEE